MFGIPEVPKGIHLPDSLNFKARAERERNWRMAREAAQSSGVIDVLKNRALILREEDSTVELWENSGRISPDHTLTLLFDGDMSMADAYFKLHGYKGVRITTSASGDRRIEYTERDKWVDLDRPRNPVYGEQEALQNDIFSAQKRADEVSGLRNSIDKFRSKEIDYQK